MSEELSVRAEDFRKAWPHALARALSEVADLTELLDEQRRQVFGLAQVIPKMLAAAEQRLEESTQRGVDALAAAEAKSALANEQLVQAQAKFMTAFEAERAVTSEQLIQSQTRFMACFESERASLERARADADAQMTKLHKKTVELDAARLEFNSRGLFSRIFART